MKSDVTKRSLSAALKLLLQKKPISKITINDITAECGISRMTFYYHFRDIYDLAEWTMQETLRPVIGENTQKENWRQGFLALLTALRENQALVLNVYQSIDRDLIERYMGREVTNLLLPVVNAHAEGLRISASGAESVARFYSYALIGVVTEWIQHSMRTSPEDLVARTEAILRGDIRNSLENMARFELSQRPRTSQQLAARTAYAQAV